jgi:hypothetical protein
LRQHIDPVHLVYNSYFSAYFFSRNSIFLSQQISQQCFSAGLSAQPNGAIARLNVWMERNKKLKTQEFDDRKGDTKRNFHEV